MTEKNQPQVTQVPDPDDLERALGGRIYFEVIAPKTPDRPQMLACSRCGADVSGGKKHRDRHEAWHKNLQAFRLDLQDILLDLNRRTPDA